jgi:hypothetical protein
LYDPRVAEVISPPDMVRVDGARVTVGITDEDPEVRAGAAFALAEFSSPSGRRPR